MIGSLLLIAGAIYVGLSLCLYLFQQRLVYFPTKELIATPASIGLSYEDVYFASGDATIHGWYVPAQRANVTVLFSHGNAGNISHRLESLALFNALGVNVFIFDYAGYGLSEGKPSEEQTYQDMRAAWQFLIKTKGAAPSSIVAFGRSLGGAIAVWLASKENPGALIVESSFLSVPDMGAKLYPLMPVRLLARIHYDSASRIDEIETPKLFIHSRNDEIVPFEQGRALFEKASSPKQFVTISGGHNQGFIESGEEYIAPLQSFLLDIGRHAPGIE